MASMAVVKEHLLSIAQGSHLISTSLKTTETIKPEVFLELMRHVHGAIDELSKVVQDQSHR
jgi:hypothetical protein